MTLAKRKIVVIPVLMALVIAVLALSQGTFSPTVAEAGGACGSRLEAPVGPELQSHIAKACYDPRLGKDQGVQLFLTGTGTWSCIFSTAWCRTYASFVVHNTLWKGDRPLDSVTTEIQWHAMKFRSYPVHIQYRCQDLRGAHEWLWNC